MKADDIRQAVFKHPLFSFEYPETFHLVLLNQIPYEGATGNYSYVKFRGPAIGYPLIMIMVQKKGFDNYHNASEKFEHIVNQVKSDTNNITTSKILVYGILADYLEYCQVTKEEEQIGVTLYLERNTLYRNIIFDYSDMIWEISMSWNYYISEPPEAQEYFNRVIETFKFVN